MDLIRQYCVNLKKLPAAEQQGAVDVGFSACYLVHVMGHLHLYCDFQIHNNLVVFIKV